MKVSTLETIGAWLCNIGVCVCGYALFKFNLFLFGLYLMIWGGIVINHVNGIKAVEELKKIKKKKE